jgi:hypothetical protein
MIFVSVSMILAFNGSLSSHLFHIYVKYFQKSDNNGIKRDLEINSTRSPLYIHKRIKIKYNYIYICMTYIDQHVDKYLSLYIFIYAYHVAHTDIFIKKIIEIIINNNNRDNNNNNNNNNN